MRIRVLDLLVAQQHAAALQQLDDQRIGLEDLLAFVLRQAVAQDAGLVHIAVQVEAVLHAGVEVVSTMCWSGVHRARTGVHGDVVAEHAEDAAIEERMSEGHALQLRAGERAQAPSASPRLHFSIVCCASSLATM